MTPRPLDYASPAPRSRTHWLMSRFSRRHWWIAAGIWVLFSALTLTVLLRALDNAARLPVVVATLSVGSVLGPMTGAISRDWQSCCRDFSLSLLPYCGGVLALAVVVQWLLPPGVWWREIVRLLIWAAGLLVWFGGGIVSLGHALS